MFGEGLIKGLGITIKRQFQKHITEQYPEEMPHLADRYRGCLVFEPENCIACGLCMKACPNKVLSLETFKDANNKKQLLSYSIDLQYCMFCNYCVEACPKSCLSFNHNFELTQFNRSDIKIAYMRPGGAQAVAAAQQAAAADGTSANEDAAKKEKQLNAMITALQKNPQKVVSKLLESEEEAAILAEILLADEKKLSKVAALMVEDKEKARKVASAFVSKELKNRQNQEGGDN